MSDDDEAPASTKVSVPDKLEEAVRRGVEDFVQQHLRNSVFSRETEAWNHFVNKMEALIKGVVEEVKGL